MVTKCCPACMTCNQLSIEGRCPIDPDAKQAWEPGDLNKMFERLANEPYLSKYDVNVLSRDPWVITMDNVLTAEEAGILIELGANEGYVRSSDVGKRLADGTFDSKVSDFRTSYNAWCQDECYRDPVTQRVIERISNFTGIDDTNSEYLQMLKYEPGQYYKAHHDYIVHNRDRQQGVRILTVFLYLNDVEEGGGTNFDTLDITVEPKTGRALLWPSVLDDEPHEKDGRTTHQALPVIAGVKVRFLLSSMNYWSLLSWVVFMYIFCKSTIIQFFSFYSFPSSSGISFCSMVPTRGSTSTISRELIKEDVRHKLITDNIIVV